MKYYFSNRKFVRKWIGGYWECWYIDIIHGDVWIFVTKEQAYDPKYRPGCGYGTPYCEYYPIGYFDSKLYFTKEEKIRLGRITKLNKVVNV